MIRKELYDKERKLYRTYSDEDYRIRQVETGIVFDDAVDTEDSEFTYEETDEKIEYDGNATEEDYINALNQLGVFE